MIRENENFIPVIRDPLYLPFVNSTRDPLYDPVIKKKGQICCKILFQEQAPSCVLKFALRERFSGSRSLVCTEICFAGACFRSKLPRVYWLGYLTGSVFQKRVSGASSFVCTGWSTYSGACFGSVFHEQAPSCVPTLRLLDCRKATKGLALKTLVQQGDEDKMLKCLLMMDDM